MRTVFIVSLIFITTFLQAQNGYIKLSEDSTLVGYLKYYVSSKDGHQGIELWKTKKDKNPIRIPKSSILEYAITKDTFKVLQQFQPFSSSDMYFELVDAERKSGGKVNLYIITNCRKTVTYMGGQGASPGLYTPNLIPDENLGLYTYLYILEDKRTGSLQALASYKEKLKEQLYDFFPDSFIDEYSIGRGAIRYKDIPDLVKKYNTKHRFSKLKPIPNE